MPYLQDKSLDIFGPVSMADSFSTYYLALRPHSTVPNVTDTETPEQGVQ